MKVHELVDVLRSIAPQDFNPDTVIARLADVVVDDQSLQPYLFWEPGRYTRNLIYRNDTFEILAVCWEKGCQSKIHDHAGQDCWLYVHQGNLCIDSFDLVDPKHCDREGTDVSVVKRDRIDCVGQGTVDHRGPQNDLHQVINLASFNGRAVSLHVYARPIDQCIIYDEAQGNARRITMCYDSIEGRRVIPVKAPSVPATPAALV